MRLTPTPLRQNKAKITLKLFSIETRIRPARSPVSGRRWSAQHKLSQRKRYPALRLRQRLRPRSHAVLWFPGNQMAKTCDFWLI